MNRIVLAVLLFAFWILLTWTGADPGPAYLQDVGAGLAAAVLVAWIMGESATPGATAWLDPRRYGWAVIYLVVLAAYVIRANLDVAYRVLHPALPIRPGIVRVHTRLRHPAARTVLGNSITLTPGTLTVDMREDGVMMVHWIYVRTTDAEHAARHIIGRFEWLIERILESPREVAHA